MCSDIVINRGATRPSNSVKNVPLYWKGLYWSEFLSQIYIRNYLINIDESGFGRSVKESYSWFPKSKSAVIISEVHKGKANLILEVSQKGDYFGLISNRNVWSKDYCIFLLILVKLLRVWEVNIRTNVILIQD